MTKAMHRIQRKNKFLPYLLILPSMLLFSMFTFYPFLKTIALSFFLTDKRGNPTKWAGISNWVRVLSKETFWKVIAITLEIAGINLVFTFGLAIFFALLSSQKKKGGKLYQTMYALPMAIASSPAAAIFLFIFRQKNGVINSILAFFHLPQQSIINTPGAIVLGMVYNFLPFMVLPIYNVLAKIDKDVIYAARDLGANEFQTFTQIIFPLSIPGIISGITMVFVPALTTFVISDLLGGSKILLIGNVIEQEFKQGSNWHTGSGLSLVLMIFIIASMAVIAKYDKNGEGTAF